MGVCWSCCGGDGSGENRENNERTHLLVDPVSSQSNNINRVQSDEYLSRSPHSQGPRKDEQSALSRILLQTATNVIDVAALGSHDLEQHEYYERTKAYNARLHGLARWTPPPRPALILTDIPNPEAVFSTEPISRETLNLITNALELVTEAVAAVKVEHKEDLVVPFRIP